MTTQPLLSVRNLAKHYDSGRKLFGGNAHPVRAVDGVSFDIAPGEVVGLVGESGSGKTTVGRTVLNLHRPTSGEILFEGRDICHATHAQMRRLRARMQMIFQDPFSSLNPRARVETIIGEGLELVGMFSAAERRRRVLELLEQVSLSPEHLRRFPHEFSGGQRQRLSIARALAVSPKLIVADEPVAALDVSIQAQIMNLIADLQRETGVSLLFISHDLGLVEFIADRVMVMYLGRIVEIGSTGEIFGNPRHPYTRALLSASPEPDPRRARARKRQILQGDPPSPANPPSGCTFRTRCPFAIADCAAARPELRRLDSGQLVACSRDVAVDAVNGV
ncbi:ABC transporter ATP-binding protein [Celeribacter indicus]|uniref:Oligopeptide/dipeptide ABC transporter, ATPase subunit n=1 Tax=Celeribacter indicus TaxID=1208324 RepID=A0A0B5DVW5_9RHOB|nr:oligopeptide/dipeptide ABC transporter ATP-binding protein [Celeribacter indicus]AJE47528.1 oligopeptide/dipeptide ABC transporter, ATPase subunit [Celeribacter indicus]SDW09310.1 peptide/nickel transport system ATP-binding protein [Celeribacter indicus]